MTATEKYEQALKNLKVKEDYFDELFDKFNKGLMPRNELFVYVLLWTYSP